MVEVPVSVGNESPEVVDAVDTVVGGLEKDRQDGIGEGVVHANVGQSVTPHNPSLGSTKKNLVLSFRYITLARNDAHNN